MGLDKILYPGFSARNSSPTSSNTKYINVNYGGLNYCVVRDSTNGFVLPNCTGYCWGRALETTKSTKVDLSNNQASVWFAQNKKKWDEGTGGYPYLDFINKEVSLPGGIKQSGLSTTEMLKLINLFVMPGNIICYGEGYSQSTKYTYDENGHVQTIEEMWADVDAANQFKKIQFNFLLIGEILVQFIASNLLAILGLDNVLIINFVIWLTQNNRIEIFKNIEKNLGINSLIKYLRGTQYSNLIKNLSEEDFSRLIEILENYNFNGLTLYTSLTVLLDVLLTGVTLSKILDGIDLVYSPVFKVSESFYSGDTADHKAWETNFVNLQTEISTASPTVQGIIMIPPKLSKVNKPKNNFPWETISEYY